MASSRRGDHRRLEGVQGAEVKTQEVLKLEKLKKELSCKKEEITDLKKENQRASRKAEKVKDDLAKEEERCKDLTRDNQKLQDRLEDVKGQWKLEHWRLQQKTTRLKELREELKRAQDEKIEMQRKLRLDSKEKQVEDLKKDVERRTSRQASFNQEHRTDFEALQNQLEKVKTELAEEKQRFSILKNNYQTIERRLEDDDRQLKISLQNKTARFTELSEGRMRALEENNMVMLRKFRLLQEEKAECENNLREQVSGRRSDVAKLTLERDEALFEKDEELAEEKQRFSILKNDYQTIQTMKGRLEEENRQLKTSLQHETARLKELSEGGRRALEEKMEMLQRFRLLQEEKEECENNLREQVSGRLSDVAKLTYENDEANKKLVDVVKMIATASGFPHDGEITSRNYLESLKTHIWNIRQLKVDLEWKQNLLRAIEPFCSRITMDIRGSGVRMSNAPTGRPQETLAANLPTLESPSPESRRSHQNSAELPSSPQISGLSLSQRLSFSQETSVSPQPTLATRSVESSPSASTLCGSSPIRPVKRARPEDPTREINSREQINGNNGSDCWLNCFYGMHFDIPSDLENRIAHEHPQWTHRTD